MKYTLLELTQSILSSMDSDEVTSINDTVESLQVVEVIKTVYDDIISRGDLQSNKTLFNLTQSTDVLKPIIMTKPAKIDKIEWIKYDTTSTGDVNPEWTYLQYLQPHTFIDMMHQQPLSETWVDTFNYTFADGSTIAFYYRNDTGPQYYTTFDDNTVFFDAYNNTVDTQLKTSKILGYGSRVSEFQKLDSYVPNLQPGQFALLLNEAKSLAWAELKQTANPKAEQAAKRNWVHLQKTRNQIPDQGQFTGTHPFFKTPNFARRR